MTKIEIEEQIRDIKKLMENSQEKLSELEKMLNEKSNEIPLFPTFNNEDMYYISETGKMIFTSNLTSEIINDFNAFHSRAFAQEFAEKCKMIAMLLHCKQYLCPTYFPNFKDEREDKWVVCYDYRLDSFKTFFWNSYWESQVYFDTKENAQKAADWMNEHFKFN